MKRSVIGLVMGLLLAGSAQAKTWDDCMQNGDLSKKVQACGEVIDSDKTDPRDQIMARLHRGYALRMTEKFDAAFEDIALVLENRPDDARAHYERGMILRHREEYRDAVHNFDVAVRGMSEHAFAWVERGRVNYLLGNFWSAAQDLTEALRLDPEYAYAYDLRAWVRCRQDRPVDAADDWQAARLHDPDNVASQKIWLRDRGFLPKAVAAVSNEELVGAVLAYSNAGCPEA